MQSWLQKILFLRNLKIAQKYTEKYKNAQRPQ